MTGFEYDGESIKDTSLAGTITLPRQDLIKQRNSNMSLHTLEDNRTEI